MTTYPHLFPACVASLFCFAPQLSAQEVLPFPEPPSASTAGKTLATSQHQWRTTPNRLPDDAPNIVIFMTDDAGFSNPFYHPPHAPRVYMVEREAWQDQ